MERREGGQVVGDDLAGLIRCPQCSGQCRTAVRQRDDALVMWCDRCDLQIEMVVKRWSARVEDRPNKRFERLEREVVTLAETVGTLGEDVRGLGRAVNDLARHAFDHTGPFAKVP